MKIQLQKILENVCSYYDVDPQEVLESPRGTRTLIKARDIYFWILHQTGRSHHEIAKIGKRERSSVTHSLKRTNNQMKNNALFRNELITFFNSLTKENVCINS